MPGRLRDPGPSAQDVELHEKVRAEGDSRAKAARIAKVAARAARSAVAGKGAAAGDYEEWTLADLRRKAAQIGIAGRSTMRKSELISALRHH
jgi:hypothetical protein